MLDLGSPGLPPALSVPFSLVAHAAQRLVRQVADMSQAELEYRGPSGDLNSTATLIAHIAYIDLVYLHIIMGRPIDPALEEEYGPYQQADGALPVVTGRSVDELLGRHHRVIEMARAYLKGLTDADAARQVQVPWWSQPATVQYVLWHMAGHSMFHQGQISRLRAWYKGERPGE
jgi:uncharacterized damage-inducible protein DinB